MNSLMMKHRTLLVLKITLSIGTDFLCKDQRYLYLTWAKNIAKNRFRKQARILQVME
jgi:hypothetical protein